MQTFGFTLLLLALLPVGATAHSGHTAIAYPLDGIEIDGDLSDWPVDLTRYDVDLVEYGVPPADSLDLSATFRVGYSSGGQALFVAVEVRDESVVIDTSQTAEWDTQDGCDLFLTLQHPDLPATAVQFGLYGERLMYGNANFAEWHYARGDGWRIYEWRLDLAGMAPAATGWETIGFDVVLEDKDDDGSYSWVAWSQGTRKAANPDRLGDLMFANAGQQLATLRGRLTWADSGQPLANERVLLRPIDSQVLATETRTGTSGRFLVDLPAGGYVAQAAIGTDTGTRVDLHAPDTLDVELTTKPTTGSRVRAGAGTRVPANVGLRRGAWHQFGSTDGLPHSLIYTLTQSASGNLWMARNGISLYDGDSFLHFTVEDGLPDNEIWTLVSDGADGVWIGSSAGLSHFDGVTFTTYTQRHGLADDRVRAVLRLPDDTLWIGTEGGLSRFDGRVFRSFTTADGLSSNVVTDLCADANGTLWVGTESGVTGMRDGHMSHLRSHHTNRVHNEVRSLACTEDGLWIGTEAGLNRWDGESVQTVHELPQPNPYEAGALLVDRDGGLWVGHSLGVDRYVDGSWTRYQVDDGLGMNRVYHILEDHEGSLWFAGDGGLSRYDAKAFTRLDVGDGLLSDHVEALVADSGMGLLIGSDGGLQRLTTDGLILVGDSDAPPLREVRDIVPVADGGLWVGSTRGLHHYDGTVWRTYTVDDGLVHNWVQALAVDSQGALWAATWGGVSRLRDGVFTNMTVEDGLGHKLVWDIIEDRQGRMWFGTEDGIDRLESNGTLTHIDEEHGLPHRVVRVLLEDRDGVIWAGTDAGLARSIADTHWVTEPESLAESVAYNQVWDLLEDRRGHLWIGTEGGIGRYDGQVLQTLLRRDGLGNNAVRSLAMDAAGDVWIGTLRGVTRYRVRETSPSVRLDGVIADRRYNDAEEITLAGRQPLLAFEYFARSYKTRPDAVVYRYRLRGYDEQFRTTRQRRVEYRDVGYGDYVFEVQAVDRDMTYSDDLATAHLRVTWPYAWLAVTGLLGAVVLLSAWLARGIWERNRSLRRSHSDLAASNDALQVALDEREALLKEVHHRVKNNMQVITSMLNLRAGHTDDEDSRALLQESQARIHTMALVHEQLYQSDTVAEIDLVDYIDELTSYLSAQAVQPGVRIATDVQPGLRLDLERATSFGLLLHELVSNALRHAFPERAGTINISARFQGSRCELLVADDGVGLPDDVDIQQPSTLGLQLVQALARQLHADIDIRSEQGTSVSLVF